MTDTDRMYEELVEAGPRGVHTLDLRRKGISGNPSQRATDIEAKYGVRIHRETERQGDRNGSRYTLTSVGVGAGQGSDLPIPVLRSEEYGTGNKASVDSGTSPETPDESVSLPLAGCQVSGETRLFDFGPSAYDPYSEAA